MRKYHLSLIVKITAIVIIAFALILGNEIRLGIERYRKNTIESDAEIITRNLDKFSKDYSNLNIYESYGLDSDEFLALYDHALYGNYNLIKSLVTPQGKILDISRETISETLLCMTPKTFGTQEDRPQNLPIYLYLNNMDDKDIDLLEEYMTNGKEMLKVKIDVVFEKETKFTQNNEFRDIDIKKIQIEDDVVIDHGNSKDAIEITGTLAFYSSQNKEVFFGNNKQMITYGSYSHMATDNKQAVVIDYRDAIKGVHYQLQKNFNQYVKQEYLFYSTSYGDYYLLDNYRYNGKDYSSILLPIYDMVTYNQMQMKENQTDDELKQKSLLGYVIVTKEYTELTKNSLRQFMLDNSSTYLLSLVLLTGISLSIAYIIVKPIHRIENSAKHIARREFDYPIDMSRHDELGDLANSIDIMSKELEKTISHLYQEIDKVKNLENIRKEFVSNFTHEIKTPLGIINGFSELVQLEQDESKRNEYIDIIQNETHKINQLVKAMLDYSRLESQAITLNLEETDLSQLLETSVEELQYLIDKKNIQMILDIQPVCVKVDRFRITMVYSNFICNAIRYSPEQGVIKIVLNEHMFSIENESDPIPQEDIEKIWLTFHKVNKSRNDEGTGLGLAICRTIFELHHFEYGVENTKQGVKFYFTF